MKPRIKRQWVAALRSGDFVQGLSYLASSWSEEDGWHYCCLGVLCELAIQDGVQLDVAVKGPNGSAMHKSYDGQAGALPQKVQDWAGLNHDDPIVDGISLASRNDTPHSFKEIADTIEQGAVK